MTPSDVRQFAAQVETLDRDDVEEPHPRLYAELDRLYDTLLAFFNAKPKR